jgi:hypothetical protein
VRASGFLGCATGFVLGVWWVSVGYVLCVGWRGCLCVLLSVLRACCAFGVVRCGVCGYGLVRGGFGVVVCECVCLVLVPVPVLSCSVVVCLAL